MAKTIMLELDEDRQMSCQDELDCKLRHKRQDETETKITEIYEVICGGLHPENSLSTKVNNMYKEHKETKNFIKGCIVSLIVLIFWCGYQYATLTHCVDKINKLEKKIEQFSR